MANPNETELNHPAPPPARTFSALGAPEGHRACTTVGGAWHCECGVTRMSREGLTIHHLNAAVIAAVDGAPPALLDSVRTELVGERAGERWSSKRARTRQAIPTLTLADIDAEYAKAGGR